MAYQTKYISTGDSSKSYGVSDYQPQTNRQQQNCNFPDEIKNPVATDLVLYNEGNSNKRSFKKGTHQRYGEDQQFVKGPIILSSGFKGTNYQHVSQQNPIYSQFRRTRQNYLPSKLNRQYPWNINSDNPKSIEYNKVGNGCRPPLNHSPVTEKIVTRCCCCGRNRLLDEKNSYYGGNFDKQTISHQNLEIPKQYFRSNDNLPEHRIVQYNRHEFVIPDRNFCSIREVAQEHVYTQFNNHRNICVKQSSSPNLKVYSRFEGSSENLKKKSTVNNLSHNSIFDDITNNRNSQMCRSPSPLLARRQISSVSNTNIERSRESNYLVNEDSDRHHPNTNNSENPFLISFLEQYDSGRESDCLSDTSLDIDTQELCRFVADELKRYSISQSTFARKVLNRSQGTLSDMLRNPKPWNQLKTGRITFVRMHEWSCLPERERFRILVEGGKFMAPERRRRIRSKNRISKVNIETDDRTIRENEYETVTNNI
ncbi:Homeobox protein onecut [Strongyloides ratti]|uniref:Homeobox protein onecut n=1 Tax=Strongyloides ratti TaxID=34506 RepID=A0A090LA42_STRRB|nr:Homeobox protein onecut [Strongyloides ratti]CEF66636.1 Homeobox protein onecut [Strongyloides ratti]